MVALLWLVWLFFVICCVYLSSRNRSVYELRKQLSDEEQLFVKFHFKQFYENKVIDINRRQMSLPRYYTMLFKIWIPVRSFTNSLKPLDEYYFNEKGDMI